MTMLIVLAGLPGVGKSTIARGLARALEAAHVRVDTIEQALRESGTVRGEMNDAGYRIAYGLAEQHLRRGISVVADSVNPWPLTRDAWRAIGDRAAARVVEIEIVCSNRDEHRRRVNGREGDIAGLRLPTWDDVLARDYRGWVRDHLTYDTSGASPDESVAAIVTMVREALP